MLHQHQVLPLHTLIYLAMAGALYIVVEFTLVLAYKFAPAKDIALFRYTDVIFSAILGFAVFGHFPSTSNLIGYVIIISAAILLIIKKQKNDDKYCA
jgi:drug/metabolite transporter (DMT)-like permease